MLRSDGSRRLPTTDELAQEMMVDLLKVGFEKFHNNLIQSII